MAENINEFRDNCLYFVNDFQSFEVSGIIRNKQHFFPAITFYVTFAIILGLLLVDIILISITYCIKYK